MRESTTHRRQWAAVLALLGLYGMGLGDWTGAARADDLVTVSATKTARIDPRIYGLNYDWNVVADSDYGAYVRKLTDVTHFTLQRFPSGWNAEFYDWNANNTPEWKKRPESPGANADRVLSTSPEATFITPSHDAIDDPASLPFEVEKTLAVVQHYGNKVKVWEIGNEWWMQTGARRNPMIRAHHIQAYSALVAAVVPQIHTLAPTAEIYVTGDWQHPEEFGAIRRIVGESVWSQIKGVSVHIYCGTEDPQTLCVSAPERLAKVRSVTGKSDIYASEWNVPRVYTRNNFGMPHANEVGIAFGILVRAGVDLAAYWPVVKKVPSISLLNHNYDKASATGSVFGWLSQHYRGSALDVRGDLSAIASEDASGVNVFVFTRDQAIHNVTVALPKALASGTPTSEVMYAASPDGIGSAQFAQLSVTTKAVDDEVEAQFVLNPGTPGRGAEWEIARISFARSTQ